MSARDFPIIDALLLGKVVGTCIDEPAASSEKFLIQWWGFEPNALGRMALPPSFVEKLDAIRARSDFDDVSLVLELDVTTGELTLTYDSDCEGEDDCPDFTMRSVKTDWNLA